LFARRARKSRAQKIAEARWVGAPRWSYVRDKLRLGWSPEEIAGRLKRKNNSQTVICHETIYRYIYSSAGKQKNLSEYLVRNHKIRWKWKGRK